jgi:hypothetical protein
MKPDDFGLLWQEERAWVRLGGVGSRRHWIRRGGRRRG